MALAIVSPKLLKKAPGHCAHKGDRNEDNDNREVVAITASPISFVASMAPSSAGSFFLDVAKDIFQHHDGVIDNDTDGQHQREQGVVIEREAHVFDDGERGDDGGGHCDGSDQGGTHVSHED